MPIIDGNRRIEVTKRVSHRGHGTPTDPRNNPHSNRISMKLSGPDWNVERGGSYGKQLLEDMRIVREHFGANISDALRISLHLTANAIRANKALPEITND